MKEGGFGTAAKRKLLWSLVIGFSIGCIQLQIGNVCTGKHFSCLLNHSKSFSSRGKSITILIDKKFDGDGIFVLGNQYGEITFSGQTFGCDEVILTRFCIGPQKFVDADNESI